MCDALRELNRICFKILRRDPEAEGLRPDIYEHVTMTLTWGCDEAQQVFEHFEARRRKLRECTGESPDRPAPSDGEAAAAAIAAKDDESPE